MKLIRKAGATSNILQVFIQDSSSTVGAGLTGLAFNSGSLTAYYHRDTDTTTTAISLVTMTVGTFTSSGFKEIDATNMPGWYQFCPPDAALASGAKSVGFHLKGASNMAPLPIEVDLVAYDPMDAVHLGLTSLPNVTAGGNGGLPLGDASGRIDVGKILGTASAGAAGYMGIDWASISGKTTAVDLTQTTIKNLDGNTVQTGDSYARLGAPAGASVSADVAAVKTDSAAIKTQTDKLTFTVANQIDANVLDWKSATAPAMTGDAYARIGAAGAGLTALGDTRIAHLDADVSTRLSTSGYTAPDNADIATILSGVNAIYSLLGTPAGASVSADIAALLATVIANRTPIRKNTALLAFPIVMTDSTNHAPVTGLTLAVHRSIDAGAFSTGTIANIVEIGNGWYAFDFGAGDLNGTTIAVRCSATGADDLDFTITTSP